MLLSFFCDEHEAKQSLISGQINDPGWSTNECLYSCIYCIVKVVERLAVSIACAIFILKQVTHISSVTVGITMYIVSRICLFRPMKNVHCIMVRQKSSQTNQV